MISIALDGVGKRYNRHWVFRNLSHGFEQDRHTVILGPNGSGKSTLLQVILGSHCAIRRQGDLHLRRRKAHRQ
jgi:ABC-type molybdenum transport system ATPase subunit/photorepair protein PhrA